jgi:hypothetical protein
MSFLDPVVVTDDPLDDTGSTLPYGISVRRESRAPHDVLLEVSNGGDFGNSLIPLTQTEAITLAQLLLAKARE